MSKNSDSSSPNGVLAARMKTVRKREPCVFVRSQTSGSEPACAAGRIRLGRRVGRRGAGKRRSRELDAEDVVIEGEAPLGVARAVNPVEDPAHRADAARAGALSDGAMQVKFAPSSRLPVPE